MTINAGLRYTLNFPSTELHNQGAIFNLQTRRLEYLGVGGFPETARELHKLNFGPRLGIAYRLNDKTVVRAGTASSGRNKPVLRRRSRFRSSRSCRP